MESFEKGDYYNAYTFLRAALDYKNNFDHPDLWYVAGQSAYKYGLHEQAEEAYLNALELGVADSISINYDLGDTYLALGDYDNAVKFYTLSQEQNEPEWNKAVFQLTKLREYLDSARVLQEMYQPTRPVNRRNFSVAEEYSQFGVNLRPGMGSAPDTTYFTSYSGEFRKDNVKPRRQLMRLYRKIGSQPAELLPETINEPGLHAAGTAFTSTGRLVFFNKCEYADQGYKVRCDLYCAFVIEDGSWTQIQKLDESVNIPGTSTQSPAVGVDERGREYLFVSSDRPGGKGGLDLYRYNIDTETGRLFNPKWLDRLNSQGDERAPFYFNEEQALYYSSNGDFTFGGYDILRAYALPMECTDNNELTFESADNVGLPINSAFNDLYYSRFDIDGPVYFSSNRPDGNQLFGRLSERSDSAMAPNAIYYADDGLTYCCNDIFTFQPPPVFLEVETVDSMVAGTPPLADAEVLVQEFVDGTLCGELEPIETVGHFRRYRLSRNKTYRIQGSHPAYIPNPGVYFKSDMMTRGTSFTVGDQDTLFQRIIPFTQELEYVVIDPCTNQAIGDVDLAVFSQKTGGQLDLVSSPGDKVKVFKTSLEDGFNIRSETRAGSYEASFDTFTVTRELLVRNQGRLQDTIRLTYEPLNSSTAVYFDHDTPSFRSDLTETAYDYAQLKEAYADTADFYKRQIPQILQLRDRNGYIIGPATENDIVIRQTMNDFFTLTLQQSVDNLQAQFGNILETLNEGRDVYLDMVGTASPTGGVGDYNNRLSSRRISSVINLMSKYQNSAGEGFPELRGTPDSSYYKTDPALSRNRMPCKVYEADNGARVHICQGAEGVKIDLSSANQSLVDRLTENFAIVKREGSFEMTGKRDKLIERYLLPAMLMRSTQMRVTSAICPAKEDDRTADVQQPRIPISPGY